MRSIPKTSDVRHAISGADHPDHQLLKISSLKAEQKQTVVGVLNPDAWLSGSTVGVLADFGFSPDVEDFVRVAPMSRPIPLLIG